MLLFANYRFCVCRIVIVMLLLVDCRLCGCSVVIETLLLESFRLHRCKALTSICYHYSRLTFEVVEVCCTDNNRASD